MSTIYREETQVSPQELTLRAIVIGSSRLMSALVSTLVAAILSRALPIESYGLYRQIWLLYSIGLPIFWLGTSDGVLYLVPRLQPDQRKSLLFSAFALGTVLGIAFAIFIIAGGAQLVVESEYESIEPYLGIFAWFCLFTVPTTFLPHYMIATRRALLAATASLVDAAIQLLSVVIPILMGHKSLQTIMMFFLGFALLRLAGWMLYGYQLDRGHPWRPRFALVRRLLSYSVPMGIYDTLKSLAQRAPGVIVARLYSAAQFAVYSNAVFRIPFISMVTNSAMSVIIPELITMSQQGEPQKAALLWGKASARVAAIIFPLFSMLFVLAPPFTETLFSTRYRDSTPLFRIWLLEMPLHISYYGRIVAALGYRRLVVLGSAAQVLISSSLCYLAATHFGLAGVVSAGVLSAYIMPIVYFLVVCRVLRASPSQVLQWRTLAKALLASILAGGVSALVYLVGWPAPMTLILGAMVFGVFYILFGLFFGVLRWDEVRGMVSYVSARVRRLGRRSLEPGDVDPL